MLVEIFAEHIGLYALATDCGKELRCGSLPCAGWLIKDEAYNRMHRLGNGASLKLFVA